MCAHARELNGSFTFTEILDILNISAAKINAFGRHKHAYIYQRGKSAAYISPISLRIGFDYHH